MSSPGPHLQNQGNLANQVGVQVSAVQMNEFRDSEWGAQKLSSIALFKSFQIPELKRLYSQGEIISLKPKAYAVIEGEPTRGLYIILSGSMSVYKNNAASGSMTRIAYLEQGHSFGELSLYDQAPRSASVSAESVCHLFSLDANNFNRFLDEAGDNLKLRFFKSCAEDMVARFRKLNVEYITVQQLLWAHALRKSTETNPTTNNQVKDESSEDQQQKQSA